MKIKIRLGSKLKEQKENKNRNISEYYYHATLDEYLEDISDSGLVPPELRDAGTHWGGTFAQDADKVFFTDTPEGALYYGEIIQKSGDYEDLLAIPDIIILRVHRRHLPDIKKGELGSGEYYVSRSISPEQIEFLGGPHGWLKIVEEKELAKDIANFEWREKETIEEKKRFIRKSLRKTMRSITPQQVEGLAP